MMVVSHKSPIRRLLCPCLKISVYLTVLTLSTILAFGIGWLVSWLIVDKTTKIRPSWATPLPSTGVTERLIYSSQDGSQLSLIECTAEACSPGPKDGKKIVGWKYTNSTTQPFFSLSEIFTPASQNSEGFIAYGGGGGGGHTYASIAGNGPIIVANIAPLATSLSESVGNYAPTMVEWSTGDMWFGQVNRLTGELDTYMSTTSTESRRPSSVIPIHTVGSGDPCRSMRSVAQNKRNTKAESCWDQCARTAVSNILNCKATADSETAIFAASIRCVGNNDHIQSSCYNCVRNDEIEAGGK